MDNVIRKLSALLTSPDSMRRCAGAIALGELAPRDPAVIKALGEALAKADATLSACVLEAFEKIGSPDAFPFVLPLLDADDLPTKLRAAAILSRAGGRIVPEIRGRLAKAAPSQKPLLVDVLARTQSREAFQALLDLLFDPNFDLVRQTCDAVRRHVPDMTPKDRTAWHKDVVRFMSAPRVKASERVITSCLLLLGYIGRPEARTILLKHAAPKMSVYLRRHALIGLRNLGLTGAAAKAVARQILPYLQDAEEAIARLALDALESLPGAESAAPWGKLLANPHPAVRAFAARKLSAADTATANRELLRLLRHEDTAIREIAAGALAAHPGATRLLLDALAREKDGEATWTLAKILKPHREGIDKRALKRFVGLAEGELEKGGARHEALLYFLRNADPKAADGVLRSAGLHHLRAKRWAQAVECMRRLINTEGFDAEVRYALSLGNLKLSPKVLEAHVRAEDHALRGFHGLLRDKAFKLAQRLEKDKALDAADLYYVGFHFAEAAGDDKEFGLQLLEHVAKKWPKSEAGKAARGKLKLSRTAG